MKYRTRVIGDLSEIGQELWDSLAFPDAVANPFLRYAFLHALHESRCAGEASGWQPEYLTLWEEKENRLAAAAPLYRKFHSYGEYVFDWAWADAYHRHGLAYYPKLLSAIPFTPVSGPRLLAVDRHAAAALVDALLERARESRVSSLHVLYPPEDEAEALRARGLLLRSGVQFHWTNPGYESFDAFVETLERKKRKNIRSERRRIADSGIGFRRIPGAVASNDDWHFFVRCYENTYRQHRSTPYLNLDFFLTIAAAMPENLLLVIAESRGKPIASSLLVHTPQTLYGRYWGALEHVPCLHFECAYYQPIEFCIENGIDTFEGGAQGEHKMARGFLPTRTFSAHWLAHPVFASAVEDFLKRESTGIDDYLDELNERNPFKRGGS